MYRESFVNHIDKLSNIAGIYIINFLRRKLLMHLRNTNFSIADLIHIIGIIITNYSYVC